MSCKLHSSGGVSRTAKLRFLLLKSKSFDSFPSKPGIGPFHASSTARYFLSNFCPCSLNYIFSQSWSNIKCFVSRTRLCYCLFVLSVVLLIRRWQMFDGSLYREVPLQSQLARAQSGRVGALELRCRDGSRCRSVALFTVSGDSPSPLLCNACLKPLSSEDVGWGLATARGCSPSVSAFSIGCLTTEGSP